MLFRSRDIDREVATLEQRLRQRRAAVQQRSVAPDLADQLVSPAPLLLAIGAGFVLERLTRDEPRATEPAGGSRSAPTGWPDVFGLLMDAGTLLPLIERVLGGVVATSGPATSPSTTTAVTPPSSGDAAPAAPGDTGRSE